MTMLSFRVEDDVAAQVQRWAEALHVDRSELLRDAVRRHLDALASEREAAVWIDDADHERAVEALAAAADWGPDEDWSDWHDAAR